MMNIGSLNRRVSIVQPGAQTDQIGQPAPVWTELAPAWASVRYLSGVESLKADAVTATAKASVRIRYRDDVTTAMRVVFGALVFNITAVLPDERAREYVDLVCEVVA
jgi:SPP1 family predicted phage head-tail adaptor